MTRCFLSFSSLPPLLLTESFTEKSRRLRGVDSVTAVTKHCQLLLSHVYFDSATLKASASWSRCANLHNSEVYSVMPRRCYSCCALTPRHRQISPPVSEHSLHKTETLRQRKHLQGHHHNTKAFN